MKIHTGDTVIIITGKDKGKQGRVLRVLPDKNRLIVEGINMRIRHIKKTVQQPGQRISYEASLHASNVMILDPKTKKPTRIGYKVDAKTGAKKRVALLSGEMITKAATAKAAKPAKKDAKKETSAKQPEKKAPDTVAKPEKQPFWKRGFSGGPKDSGVAEGKGPEGASSMPTAHRAQGG